VINNNNFFSFLKQVLKNILFETYYKRILRQSYYESIKCYINWNGLSDKGIVLPSGMYFYKMKSSEYQSVKK
jgi:hypothetical protein